jgi:small basic protein (TIGR04137 family)
MSIDKSLKSEAGLVRHRNVLTRAERIKQLKEDDKWSEGGSPFGLPKVGHRKAAAGAKKKDAAATATAEEPAADKGKAK